MKKLLIKNGSLIALHDGYNSESKDLYLEDGIIKEIGDNLVYECETIDASGLIVSAGFIDIHTHCFAGKCPIGVDADLIGAQRGTTTIIDAGSAGPETFEEFMQEVIVKKDTRVYSLLNISKKGLTERSELNDLKKIDLEKVKCVVKKYPQYIVGLKARASSSVVGDLGILPIKMACELAEQLNKILMIHTGNFPPYLKDVLNIMKKGDILTHAFHGKEGGILDDRRELIDEAIKARDRGVLFDVGHGSASFSFATFARAKELGFKADFISTDIHCENYLKLVYSQHAVISKLINMGEDLAEMIDKVTAKPADHFNLVGLGHLKPGSIADITISKLIDIDEVVEDSQANQLNLQKKIVPVYTIISKGGSSKLIENHE
ncbi:MAG: amidohydrolase family protein [Erysipelotrichaceae bacterium]